MAPPSVGSQSPACSQHNEKLARMAQEIARQALNIYARHVAPRHPTIAAPSKDPSAPSADR